MTVIPLGLGFQIQRTVPDTANYNIFQRQASFRKNQKRETQNKAVMEVASFCRKGHFDRSSEAVLNLWRAQ